MTPHKQSAEHIFSVPPHYFDTLEERILSNTAKAMLPAQPATPPHKLTLRHTLRRRMAVAAVAVGIITTIGLRLSTPTTHHNNNASNNTGNDNTIETMIDYVMYDDNDLYAYLLDN
ncbi:MAG: hypothetical protein J6I60_01855 [Bacteroidaceae bacterium]|nr:hypothetical protein [Bacteroidaceae bacterium]